MVHDAQGQRDHILQEAQQEARGPPEAEMRDILRPGGAVPPILWNPQLQALDGTRLTSPAGWIDELGIALEVDSREYHLTPEGWQQTMRRHNVLSSYGALVLHFAPSEIRRRRRAVRGTVERACEERSASGATAAIRVLSVPGAQPVPSHLLSAEAGRPVSQAPQAGRPPGQLTLSGAALIRLGA